MALQGFRSIIDDVRERVDNFYRNHSNNAVLPEEMKPRKFEGYHWACFGIGVSLIFTGIRESKQAASIKPEKMGDGRGLTSPVIPRASRPAWGTGWTSSRST